MHQVSRLDPGAESWQPREMSEAGITVRPANELAWARVHGSASLRERWREQRIDLRELGRAPAELS